jgi:hypothetical protein
MTNDLIILRECVNQFKSAHLPDDSKESDVFEIFAMSQIFKERRLDFDEIQRGIVGGNMEGGFDGFYLLLNEENIDSLEQTFII